MYPRNNWYMAGWTSEIPAGRSFGRKILNEAMVVFRTASGSLAALEDRCSHRAMPLSAGGACEGEIIRCPYHGLEFDGAGRCTRIPGQEHISAEANIKSFPVAERDGMIWVWPGDPAKADPADIFAFPYASDPKWTFHEITLRVDGYWQLLNDNLLDTTHLALVHGQTIGGNPEAHFNSQFKARREGDRVYVQRWIPNEPPPPTYQATGLFSGNVDRWQEVVFRPGVLDLWTGAAAAGTGALDGNRDGGAHIHHFHAITPETEMTSWYFTGRSRNYRIGDLDLSEKLLKLYWTTLTEDKNVIEAQQRRITDDPTRGFLNIRNDAGGIHARRIIEDLCRAERSAELVSATTAGVAS